MGNLNNKKSIGICVVRSHIALDLPEMFQKAFAGIDFDVLHIKDGDINALSMDYICLIGVAADFPEFEKLLAEKHGSRPEVFLWQFEPFPVPDVSKEALQSVRKYVYHDFKYWHHFVDRITKTLVPKRSLLRNMLLSREFRKHLSYSQKKAYHGVGSGDIFRTSRHAIEALDHYNDKWCDCYIVSMLPRVDFLENNNIPAYFAPMGYSIYWGQDLDVKRDIGVAFIGHLKGYRKKQLKWLRLQLLKKGVTLSVLKSHYGNERTRILNRCKIVIDLDRFGWEFPLMRPILATSCGALLLTNWLGGLKPFAKEHFVQRKLEDFPDAIEHYLNNEAERSQIIKNTQDYLFNEMTLGHIVKKLFIDKMAWDGKKLHPL